MGIKEFIAKEIIINTAANAVVNVANGANDAIQKAEKTISDKFDEIEQDETYQRIASKTADYIDAASPHAERVAKAVGTGASKIGNALAKGAMDALKHIDDATKKREESKPKYFEILMINSPGKRTFTLDGKPLYSSRTSIGGKDVFYDWNGNEIGYVTCKRASLLKRYAADVIIYGRDGGMVTPSSGSPYKFQYKNCFISVGKLDGSVTIECEKEKFAFTGIGQRSGRYIYVRDPEYGDEMIMAIDATLKCMNSYHKAMHRAHLIPHI